MKKKKLFIIGGVLLLYFGFVFVRTIQSATSNYHKTFPNQGVLYKAKLFSEQVRLRTGGNSNKLNIERNNILIERLSEVEWSVNKNYNDRLPETTSRFNTISGKYLADYKNDFKLTDQSKISLQKLTKLRDAFPSQSPYWLYLQQNVDTANRLQSRF